MEEELSESGINPPAYTPPHIPPSLLPPQQVIVTQATPVVEQVPPKEGEVVMSSSNRSNELSSCRNNISQLTFT
jgi:hypothetical protein